MNLPCFARDVCVIVFKLFCYVCTQVTLINFNN